MIGGMFSDDEGNLKIVNFAVRRPCCSCCSVILICLIMTILLGAILGGDGGLPITDGQHQVPGPFVCHGHDVSGADMAWSVRCVRYALEGIRLLPPGAGEDGQRP